MSTSVAGTPDATGVVELDLAVEGMTCASCVARVEKRLNRVPGVQATVNLALEQAHVRVEVPEGGSPADVDALVAAVQAAGYDAHPIQQAPPIPQAPPIQQMPNPQMPIPQMPPRRSRPPRPRVRRLPLAASCRSRSSS